MQELRLVGVHEDGEHLLMNGKDGSNFSLPINEALRMAVSRPMEQRRITPPPPPATGPSGPAGDSPDQKPAKQQSTPLSPREIQARIRSGATAQDIVDESGQDLAMVRRYESPVRAERDYMAILAQRVEVSSPLPSHDGYRSAFGDNPAQLGDMVTYRLQAYGVESNAVEWDAWRRQDGLWNVVARFELAADSRVSVGEEPPAQWTFNPSRKTVLNTNRWAQLLSELEPLDGPLPSRRLSAVADRVFDFEAQKTSESAADDAAPAVSPTDEYPEDTKVSGSDRETAVPGDSAPDEAAADESPAAEAPTAAEAADNLLAVLRSRRGQRLGVDEDGDDALAHLLAQGNIPAAHPRPADGEDPLTGADEDDRTAPEPQRFAGLSLAPSVDDDGPAPTYSDGTPRLYDAVSTETREISIFARPNRPAQQGSTQQDSPQQARPGRGGQQSSSAPSSSAQSSSAPSTGRDTSGEDTTRKTPDEPADRKIRPKRSSVPSWDEIVFGTKGD